MPALKPATIGQKLLTDFGQNRPLTTVGIDLIRIFAMLAVISAHLTLYLPKTERIVPFFYMGRGGGSVLLCIKWMFGMLFH